MRARHNEGFPPKWELQGAPAKQQRICRRRHGIGRTGTVNVPDMETHGPLVGSLALCFTMLSPLLVLIIGLVSMWLVS